MSKLDHTTQPDPFTLIDPDNQLRPQISRVDFFRSTGFDFCWLVLEPLSIANSNDEEFELVKRFSRGQKALYFWWCLDAQVKNGGFVQFYYNGYATYVPAILKGLELVGDNDMLDLVNNAHQVYLTYKHLIDDAQNEDSFGNDLYQRLKILEDFDARYYLLEPQTVQTMEQYAKLHPNEFCVDETGAQFPINFTGKLTSKFANGNLESEFHVLNGVIEGELKTYYESGQIKSLNNFQNALQAGEQKEWYENGNQKSIITVNSDKSKEYKHYYENGQLHELVTFIGEVERVGPWLKFWENGIKKLEAETRDRTVLFHNYWNKEGKQLLENGAGLYINEYSIFKDEVSRQENEYKDYKRHGRQWTYTNGILTLYQEMANGKEHGVTKTFNNQGKLQETILYENGKELSREQNGN